MDSFTDRTWLWFAAAFYLAGFAMGTLQLVRGRRSSSTMVYAIVAVGFLLQTLGLSLRGRAVHGCPIGNTFEFFQFTAWSATALYLVIGATFRLSLLGYFTSCLSAALTLISLAVPEWDAVRRIDIFHGNTWIEFHAALALFSYGIFALLALTSTMYLLQLYSLQHHRVRGFFSFLPSILELDHISLRLLVVGVVTMSASLAVGSVYWVHDMTTVNASKLYATVGLWFAYVLVLAFRSRGKLIAKPLAWACVALFIAALFTLGPINHSRNPLPARSPQGNA